MTCVLQVLHIILKEKELGFEFWFDHKALGVTYYIIGSGSITANTATTIMKQGGAELYQNDNRLSCTNPLKTNT